MSSSSGTTDPLEAYSPLSNLLKNSSLADVQVVVGEEGEEETFHLHRAVLSLNSGYFQRMFQGNRFREGQESRVVLRDTYSGSFKFVVHYLYHGRMMNPPSKSFEFWSFLIYIYLIREALYFDIPPLHTYALTTFQRALSNEHEQARYLPNGEFESHFPIALKLLFDLYPSQSRSLDPVFKILVEKDYLRYIIRNKELQEVLDAEPMLLRRFIEIQIELKDEEEDVKRASAKPRGARG